MLSNLNAHAAVGNFLLANRHESRCDEFGEHGHVAPDRETENASREPLAEPKPACGSRFAGRYELVDLLGAQPYGDLYRAIDRETQREVAVRVVPKRNFAGQTAIQEYLSGGRHYLRLQYPLVVEVLEVGEHVDYCFVVMEFLEGHALTDIPLCKPETGHRFSLIDAVGHARALCDAYTDTKSAGITLEIDREHIILCGGAIRLSERVLLRPQIHAGFHSRPDFDTESDIEVPEKTDSRGSGEQRELHRFGHLVYDLFADEEPGATPVPLSSLRAEIPEPLDILMAQILARDPAHRPQSFERVGNALDAIACSLRTTPLSDPDDADQLPVSLRFVTPSPGSSRGFSQVAAPRGYIQIAAALAGLLALSAGILGVIPFVWSVSASGLQGGPKTAKDGVSGSVRGADAVKGRAEDMSAVSSLDLLDAGPVDPNPGDAISAGVWRNPSMLFVGLVEAAGAWNGDSRESPTADVVWPSRDSSGPAGNSVELSRRASVVITRKLPPAVWVDSLSDNGYGAERTRVEFSERDLALEPARLLFGGAFEEFAPSMPDDTVQQDSSFVSFPAEPVTMDRNPLNDQWIEITPPPVFDKPHVAVRNPSLPFLRGDAAIEELVMWLQNRAPPTDPPIKPRFKIGSIEFRQMSAEGQAGVELRFPFRVDRYTGEQLEIGAYIFKADGTPLKDLDRQYVSKRGNVYTKQAITIDSNRYRNDGFTLFLPYTQFDGLPGGAHQLQVQIFVWAGPPFEQRMARGKPQKFELTLYKFNAPRRGRR